MNIIDDNAGVDETCATLLEDYGFGPTTTSIGDEEIVNSDSKLSA